MLPVCARFVDGRSFALVGAADEMKARAFESAVSVSLIPVAATGLILDGVETMPILVIIRDGLDLLFWSRHS